MSGITLRVRLTPRAREDRIEGWTALADGGRVLVARVRSVPEKGAANRALEELLAKYFRRPKSAVTIVSGAAGRVKLVEIEGDREVLRQALGRLPARG